MSADKRRDDVYCGSCGHFVRHYVWWFGRFSPLHTGHCVHPRIKDRREDQSCPREKDPPPRQEENGR